MAAASVPGWATDELLEEWPESSPSPPLAPSKLPSIPQPQVNFDSVRAKRGSLRMLGQAAARPLPPSRSNSNVSVSNDGGPGRIVSGHVDGGRGHVSGTGLDVGVISPPSSVSSSDGRETLPAGTFVVKDGVEDDRGAHLAKNRMGPKDKDIFGALPLERMFDPPSPSVAASVTDTPRPSSNHAVSPEVSSSTPAPKPSEPLRKASHQYAPLNPSRLSKSVTPSSNDSFTTTTSTAPSIVASSFVSSKEIEADDSLLQNSTVSRREDDDSALYNAVAIVQQDNAAQSTLNVMQEPPSQSEKMSSKSPIVQLQDCSNYPFTFESPRQSSYQSAGDHSSRMGSPFNPEAEAAVEGPSHSTLNFRSRSCQPEHTSKDRSLPNPPLRLFRSTYDTYTREHLSALVDSIAVEPSPSPPDTHSARLNDWSPSVNRSISPSQPASSTHFNSTLSSPSDARSSKRLRLSPASPPPQKRPLKDWGAQGREMMDRLRNVEESIDGVSLSRFSGSDDQGVVGGPVHSDYVNHSPSPSLKDDPSIYSAQHAEVDPPKHRSNPSTSSSGYLRAAEDIMARIKLRKVSESASDSPVLCNDQQALSPFDDNRVWEEQANQYAKCAKSKGRNRTAPSPRRMLRHLSASEEIKRVADEDSASDDEQIHDEANLSLRRWPEQRRPTDHTLQANSNGSGGQSISHLPHFTADDINRYMSSSTHATSTTASASFVKHRGPRVALSHGSSSAMRMIRPDDVEGVVPDKIGKMRYDRIQMRWVRELGPVDEADESRLTGSEESVDVFAGMESLPGQLEGPSVSSGRMPDPHCLDESLREHEQEIKENADDEQSGVEQRDTRSSVSITGHRDEDRIEGCPDLNPSELEADAASEPVHVIEEFKKRSTPSSVTSASHHSTIHHMPSSPLLMTPTPSVFAPKPIRSALRNAATPADKPKKRQGWSDEATPGLLACGTTPATSGKRSVSFSDGKKTGKIIDLEVEMRTTRWQTSTKEECADLFKREPTDGDRSFLPSARTRRIQGLLDDMGELTLDDETPCKPSSRQIEDTDRPFSRASLTSSPDSHSTISTRSSRVGRSFTYPSRHAGNATFLTECSFGIAHDKLVEIITDIEPFNPHWDQLKSINLRGKKANSVARLKEFLPNLDEINLDDNAIGYLSGIPTTVRTLHVAGNLLTSLTAVNHLKNLQYLDISRNKLDSVAQLGCLIHLRELKVDDNAICDLEGIMNMDCLIKLSCVNNKLDMLDLSAAKWSKLESLNLSNNNIAIIKDLHRLSSITSINLEGNRLCTLTPQIAMPSVRILRFSDNDIASFDISLFPKIRTLYADNNLLSHLGRSEHSPPSRLENLSLRNQRVAPLHLNFIDLENVRRLYISGNALTEDFFPCRPLYSLVYLEAAACKMSQWPQDFAINAPHLKMLNLNYNYFTDLNGVKGLNNMRKLTLVGGRLGGEEARKGDGRDVMAGLRGLQNLEELDLRMNPFTLSYYFPLLLPLSSPSSVIDPSTPTKNNQDRSRMSQMSAVAPAAWSTYDTRFRKNLPDEWYSKRLVYRGLIMQTCKKMRKLDGIVVEDGERKRANQLLEAALGIRK
ncbi:leucine repeat containing protein [Cryptococcus neoformans C23]|uniref:Leucine repeat containing protein n=1 Tax=Cryptococcus neoformans (strain H99 / ATCC 208821 / CBS 10515 / FGSC 9487) TaxID=235443 RepID=J9VIG0_CRYN9|nr:leucine repeat containing protein [Cryptococcus neoformans var. grubii H99]AUB23563.1 leucine repeat containing protein [Cryptococcus neoformans var. grubii]OWZ46626.1 leucine repeat containing protein [Cryptococcus neoformans var. grubii C23]OXC85873.1 leucine repeat containing protein [Cryptococcus neoformans var. grubii AD1-7a]AFR93968.2 leucine repeat containing protein [Cryptococcus neoformans var. grubii H99]OXH36336.1 leucine repeat containing protein [Cryptococcus neoformans var. gr|eukprot:XP_012047924.1 leucine repeat containing protein [Cryptococcus neoformans var. grubii H99]